MSTLRVAQQERSPLKINTALNQLSEKFDGLSSAANTWTGAQTFNGVCTFSDGNAFANIDLSSWNVANDRFGINGATGANQFVIAAQLNITAATGATADYEKSVGLVIAQTNDPSTTHNLDAVGWDMRGYIASTNTLGRAWGGYSEARIVSGGTGDGALWAHEFHTTNNGTDQGTIGTTTSKYGAQAVADGSAASTAAYYVTKTGTAAWHYGFVVDPVALAASGTANAFSLLGKFSIDKNGILTQAVAQSGSIINFQSTSGGGVSATWANVPAVGAINDLFDINYNFATANGTQHQGAILRALQSSATNGAPSTLFDFYVKNAGTLALQMRLQSSGGLSVGASTTDPGTGGLALHPGASVTPVANGDFVIQCTSNTQLTFKYKGSDGTVRSNTLTLA